MMLIVEKLDPHVFEEDEISKESSFNAILVMKRGDVGDCMFVIFSGEVGVYIGEENDKCVATLGANKVFGEKALENDSRRGATIIAHTRTVCLTLYKVDYNNIIYVRL